MTATTQPGITLEEQIATCAGWGTQTPCTEAILASLRKLKEIREMGDVEPVAQPEWYRQAVTEWARSASRGIAHPDEKWLNHTHKLAGVIDHLRDMLAREGERADNNAEMWQRQLADGLAQCERAELAESRLAKVMEALREPTPEILNAGLVTAGLWTEPFAPATECGVPIECGLTRAEADEINAAAREDMRQVYLAMSSALLDVVGKTQEVAQEG